MNIAILGSNGLIGNDLKNELIKEKKNKIFAFSRIKDPKYYQYLDFNKYEYDLIINCIGIGAPKSFSKSISNFSFFNKEFDQLCIEYLFRNKKTKYIYLSSGSIYGNFNKAPDNNTVVQEKNLETTSLYEKEKLHTEISHREFTDLKIYDIRIFNYVSETISLNSGFFITEIFKATLENIIINCANDIFYRDFTSSHDLHKLIILLFAIDNNDVIDLYTKAPISNHELLNFFKENFNLKYKLNNNNFSSPTGAKKNYFSLSRKAQKYGFYPDYTSIENICNSFKKIKDNY